MFAVLPEMSVRHFLLCLAIAIPLGTMFCLGQAVYTNDFNGPQGSPYPEWTSSNIKYASSGTPPGTGTLPAPVVANVDSPNHAQRFLGEFGGPPIGTLGDPGYNVEQTVSLTLRDLPEHKRLRASFDLYILKSWDGTSPEYGPDQWSLSVAGGPRLFASTFSNNPKVEKEASYQDFPRPHSRPRSGAISTNTLGFGTFFGDSVYHFDFVFPHSASNMTLHFSSTLFEGKGTADESWGLDNVGITIVPDQSGGQTMAPNQQRGVNGREPSPSRTDSAPSTAASGRSP
jgi:hypothetical protein